MLLSPEETFKLSVIFTSPLGHSATCAGVLLDFLFLLLFPSSSFVHPAGPNAAVDDIFFLKQFR